jgi:hypothetical protein
VKLSAISAACGPYCNVVRDQGDGDREKDDRRVARWSRCPTSPLSDALASLTAHAPSLQACELLTHEALELSLRHQRRSSPVSAAALYVLTQLADRGDPTGELSAAFEHAGITDAAVADDSRSRDALGDAVGRLEQSRVQNGGVL